MKEYNSATVVESTVFLNLLTFVVNQTSLRHSVPLKIARAILPRNTVILLCEEPSSFRKIQVLAMVQ